jgi:hypothetical protein
MVLHEAWRSKQVNSAHGEGEGGWQSYMLRRVMDLPV